MLLCTLCIQCIGVYNTINVIAVTRVLMMLQLAPLTGLVVIVRAFETSHIHLTIIWNIISMVYLILIRIIGLIHTLIEMFTKKLRYLKIATTSPVSPTT